MINCWCGIRTIYGFGFRYGGVGSERYVCGNEKEFVDGIDSGAINC